MHQILKKLNMKRTFAVIMAVVWILVYCLPCVAAEPSGTCGAGLTWTYSNGTLTISGSGAMDDYTKRNPAPWAEWREHIRILKIESGVTSVGHYAFYNHKSMTSATLPDSISAIGDYAFSECASLKMLTLGAGVRSIGEYAFAVCTSLQSVRMPEGLTTVGNNAFARCATLRSITIPKSVTSMGSMIFSHCNGLVSAEILASVEVLPLWLFYSCDALARVTLSSDICGLEDNVFHLCHALKDIYYSGTPEHGTAILESVQESLPYFSDSSLRYEENTSNKTESTTSDFDPTKGVSVSTQLTVQGTPNANISTAVTTTTEIKQNEDSIEIGEDNTVVTMDAVINNSEGWAELVKEIRESAKKLYDANEKTMQVSVSLNHTEEIKSETLAAIAGSAVTMTVENADGSSYRIDCTRIEPEKLDTEHQMSYSLTPNTEPTKKQTDAFGDAESYLLNFAGDATIDYSPRIYVGTESADQCATMYQQIKNGKVQRVQSAIVDQDGYATFYLAQTKGDVQYYVSLDAEGEDRADAIIPEGLSEAYGGAFVYEPITYVITGERLFMGMNLAQFTYVMFAVLIGSAVVIGTVMAIFYRKKRLELLYRLKEQDSL